MATELTWLGHNAWSFCASGFTVLLDPFLDDNPVASVRADAVEAHFILVSHGHFDHIADAEKIARRTGATVISSFEICQWLGSKGVQTTHAMNIGGSYRFPFGRVKMTIAHHTSMLPDGSCGGAAAGFLVYLPEGNVYFACDTGLFYDMKLLGDEGIALAALPIGDNFTMGPEDALRAVKLLNPRRVVPIHRNTWPLIAQDAAAWARRVRDETSAEPVVLEPGGRIVL
ncbi:MAG: metal-dependent hydrolase [Thermoguttaceae bacterium]|jgi:L-ascorbate metabolism protein UlaG (beta-lactamase superfamily)|nr:metal-dependent hydrolase [Thermoguttaceae bacterium]